jgi:hypothetical protein
MLRSNHPEILELGMLRSNHPKILELGMLRSNHPEKPSNLIKEKIMLTKEKPIH